MDEDRKKQVATFRFGVIHDLVGGVELEPGEQERLIREKCNRKWVIPFSEKTRITRSTILRWVKLYKDSGGKLDALCNHDRSDNGKSRAIDEESGLALIRLRAELPKATVARLIKKAVREVILEKKMKIVLIVDEASLMRLEVFAEIHTITVFEQDSKPWLPIILTGRTNLIDKLMYQTSLPLASRIVARSHIEPVNRQEMEQYLAHHLSLTGVKSSLFDDAAVTAIHQGSGGIFRKANHLARGALIAAANNQSTSVSADHVRLAATEIF